MKKVNSDSIAKTDFIEVGDGVYDPITHTIDVDVENDFDRSYIDFFVHSLHVKRNLFHTRIQRVEFSRDFLNCIFEELRDELGTFGSYVMVGEALQSTRLTTRLDLLRDYLTSKYDLSIDDIVCLPSTTSCLFRIQLRLNFEYKRVDSGTPEDGHDVEW